MTQSKPWYLSRTILASLVTIATAAAGMIGLPVAGLDNAALADNLLELITALSGLAAIFGRVAADSRIG